MSTELEELSEASEAPEAVAVVGMAGRFPRARDLREFWANLRDGADCIHDLTDDELRETGIDPATLPPGYVKAAALLDDIAAFDAGFFGFSPREAEILDPQSRLMLECAWEALESAGYVSEAYPGWIGLYAGVSIPSYLMANLLGNRELEASFGAFHLLLSNDRDYFATRISYKLNLRGPSVNVQTACSTSLVAVHMACQSLLSYQCTLAVAGGVRLQVPQKSGYVAQEGSIFSPDGRCRAFDAKGQGALFGEGAGVVVLKRLSEALADRDPIHAVIRGSALNNDGSLKVGYTAPSVEGQAEVIALAHAVAGVDPATLSYVEAHGSGTPLGDPIEVAALTQAFRAGTAESGFCALGSVKTNVGHLEAAAGVAGLIKTVLALENGALPPSLHFASPNPQIDFASTPFFVNTELRPWPRSPGGMPRRAGVSSFGMGGTNAHVILEEAPERAPSGPSRPWQILPLSARSPAALEALTDRLVDWLGEHPETPLADAVHTLQTGRRTFAHRRALVCRDREDAVAALRARDPRRLLGSVEENAARPVVFLLPGLGDHYPGMSLGLYRHEPAFRAALDQAAELLRGEGIDLLAALYPQGTGAEAEAGDGAGAETDLRDLLGRTAPAAPTPTSPPALHRTEIAQPALFAVEYALAQVLEEWGIRPQALAGYSLGEYTAACLAGVFSFEDALRLAARRARLISGLPAGAMLSVALPEEEARRLAGGPLSLAAVNGPAYSVLAGPPDAVDALAADLAARGVVVKRLPTTHAFHSRMMEPLRDGLRDLLRGVPLAPPTIPYLSNVTGTWITPEQATDPGYWVRHLVEPVRFGAAVGELLTEPSRVLVEVGPGQALTALALQLAGGSVPTPPITVPTLRPSYERQDDTAFLLGGLARLWLAGLPIDWAGFAAHERRNRVWLPTYPFERVRYWIDRIDRIERTERAAARPAAATPPAAAPALERHARPANLRNLYVAPRNPTEESLVEIWQNLLGIAPIGVHDSFFALGGHSLLAPQLLLRMQRELGIDFPLRDLFEAPAVSELALAVEVLREKGAAALAAARETVDLRAEVVLDPAIRAEGPRATGGDPSELFLTGATGFFGAFLAAELVRRTNARIHCLVRAEDPDQAFRRLREALQARGVWTDGMADRLAAVPGDLGDPRFGLSAEAFDDLAGRVDAVYHCGAWVNFTYPYRLLKPANVLGTVESLRLAGRIRTKPLHFVSSITAVPEVEYAFRPDPTVLEDDETGSLSGLFGGYGETKWVAEQICRLARSRGIPVSIYRPGVLSGHSRTGVSNTRDMVWNMIKGAIEVGFAPDETAVVDITPVDYVARALVHISLREENLDRVYQFPHPEPPTWRPLFERLREYGYPLAWMKTEDWVRHVLTVIREGSGNALTPFASVVETYQGFFELAAAEQRNGSMKLVLFDDRNTRAALAGSGISCPKVDAGLLTTYFDYFIRTGFLPPPRDEAA